MCVIGGCLTCPKSSSFVPSPHAFLFHLADAGEVATEASEVSDESKYHFTASPTICVIKTVLCHILAE